MEAVNQSQDFNNQPSWNRERSSDELKTYIEQRFASLPDSDIE